MNKTLSVPYALHHGQPSHGIFPPLPQPSVGIQNAIVGTIQCTGWKLDKAMATWGRDGVSALGDSKRKNGVHHSGMDNVGE